MHSPVGRHTPQMWIQIKIEIRSYKRIDLPRPTVNVCLNRIKTCLSSASWLVSNIRELWCFTYRYCHRLWVFRWKVVNTETVSVHWKQREKLELSSFNSQMVTSTSPSYPIQSKQKTTKHTNFWEGPALKWQRWRLLNIIFSLCLNTTFHWIVLNQCDWTGSISKSTRKPLINFSVFLEICALNSTIRQQLSWHGSEAWSELLQTFLVRESQK